jgi:hypothetical protein
MRTYTYERPEDHAALSQCPPQRHPPAVLPILSFFVKIFAAGYLPVDFAEDVIGYGKGRVEWSRYMYHGASARHSEFQINTKNT